MVGLVVMCSRVARFKTHTLNLPIFRGAVKGQIWAQITMTTATEGK